VRRLGTNVGKLEGKTPGEGGRKQTGLNQAKTKTKPKTCQICCWALLENGWNFRALWGIFNLIFEGGKLADKNQRKKWGEGAR